MPSFSQSQGRESTRRVVLPSRRSTSCSSFIFFRMLHALPAFTGSRAAASQPAQLYRGRIARSRCASSSSNSREPLNDGDGSDKEGSHGGGTGEGHADGSSEAADGSSSAGSPLALVALDITSLRRPLSSLKRSFHKLDPESAVLVGVR